MRCKSCNAVMQPEEIIWYEEWQEHEELCHKCLEHVEQDEQEEIAGMFGIIDEEWSDDLPPWEGEDLFNGE